MTKLPEAADVVDAAGRIAPVVHHTPVMTSRAIDELAGLELHFKCEHLQRTGAFKMRGAANAVFALRERDARRGVVTHSSGNFAQAVALAARLRGIDAHIVMPSNASAVKRAAVEGYGGSITACEPNAASREATAAEIQARTGATLVHPYDQLTVIAGQGTAALELLEHVSGLDAIITPIGGGGLFSGCCLAAHDRHPGLAMIGAEPAGADDAARSLASGTRLPQTDPRTIADGLLTSLGDLTWPIVRDHAATILTVDEDAIVAAMKVVWSRLKQVIEPSAAVAVAVALSGRLPSNLRRVGVVLSGGNVDLDRLPW
jgi:threonine dehydratase/serine racemase